MNPAIEGGVNGYSLDAFAESEGIFSADYPVRYIYMYMYTGVHTLCCMHA